MVARGIGMFDPNREDFNARVLRLRRDHAMGRAFVAGGALGRSDFRRGRVRKRPALRAGLFLLAFAFGLKGALHQHLGAEGYAARVAELQDGSVIATAQFALMQADPVTLLVASAIGQVKAAL